MQVKGTMLLEMVKLIRANKDKDWDKWFDEKDWEIIKSRILPSQWYPYKTFEHIGLATFHEIAQSNLDTARVFGRFLAEGIDSIYKNVLVEGDPATSIKKFTTIRATFMKGVEGDIEVVEEDSNWLKFKVLASDQISVEGAKVFSHQMAGTLEGMVEQTGGKNPTVTVKEVEDGYELLVKWE